MRKLLLTALTALLLSQGTAWANQKRAMLGALAAIAAAARNSPQSIAQSASETSLIGKRVRLAHPAFACPEETLLGAAQTEYMASSRSPTLEPLYEQAQEPLYQRGGCVWL